MSFFVLVVVWDLTKGGCLIRGPLPLEKVSQSFTGEEIEIRFEEQA